MLSATKRPCRALSTTIRSSARFSLINPAMVVHLYHYVPHCVCVCEWVHSPPKTILYEDYVRCFPFGVSALSRSDDWRTLWWTNKTPQTQRGLSDSNIISNACTRSEQKRQYRARMEPVLHSNLIENVCENNWTHISTNVNFPFGRQNWPEWTDNVRRTKRNASKFWFDVCCTLARYVKVQSESNEWSIIVQIWNKTKKNRKPVALKL